MPYGEKGHLGISAQQSFNTATNSWEYLPFISEGLATEKEILTEEGMVGRFAENDFHEGMERTAGDVVFEPDPVNIGHLLKGVFGSSVSSTITGAMSGDVFEHIFVPTTNDFDAKSALPPYTIQMYRDVGSAFQYTDTIFNTFNLEIAAGTIQKMTVGMLSRTMSTMDKTTPSYVTDAPYLWNQTSISIAGTANTIMENISISFENQVEGIPFLDGTKRIGKWKRTGGAQLVRISGTMDFEDQTEFNNFVNQTEQRLLIDIDNTSVASIHMLSIDIPKMHYETYPPLIGGAGRLSVSFTARGAYSVDSSYAIRITLINSRSNGY
jgi:hypothetical protein